MFGSDIIASKRRRLLPWVVCALVCLSSVAHADVQVTVSGPGGSASQTLSDEGGSFDVNLPLSRNAPNEITVKATNADGEELEKKIQLTQVSLQEIVVAEITTEPLPPERIEQLVNEGVIDLDDPENFNVSQFNIVLTIAGKPTPVSVPIVMSPSEPTGYENISLPNGFGSGGAPKPRDVQIVVFETFPPTPPGEPPPPPIPGVMVIEGRIKSLKEFFSVRLLIMNNSGIFTLEDVNACLSFPNGGLSHTLPDSGHIVFGDIPPGDGTTPGQKEREFIIRGDDIGVRRVKCDFAGTLSGPGLPTEDSIAFSGAAESTVEVKGPPEFLVQVFHPEVVIAHEPYDLTIEIQNVGDTPALYASLELEVGFDMELVFCDVAVDGDVTCTNGPGPELRNFGHIFPGDKVRETFRVNPLITGPISSCLGISDQNINLQVNVGVIGCLTGHFPPTTGVPPGLPTVAVVPQNNQLGVGTDSPVAAFFSEAMDEETIETGAGKTFNVFNAAGNRIPGKLRFELINDRSVVIWQVDDGLANRLLDNTVYDVVLTQGITDLSNNPLFSAWASTFKTTSSIEDFDPPDLTLNILPPVDPNNVIPGQPIVINAYPADQGSGIAAVELRCKDLTATGGLFKLVDQKTVFTGADLPAIFTINSADLIPGHTYQFKGSAYDRVGNVGESTIAAFLATTAAPPVIAMPPDPTNFVLKGVPVNLKPLYASGGVTRVEYHLNTDTSAVETAMLPPWQSTLDTLSLTVGVHNVNAMAIDGLSQTGADNFVFTLIDNTNTPRITFVGVADGAQFVTGSIVAINANVSDTVGVHSVHYYFGGLTNPPFFSGQQPFSINTAGLPTGTYQIVVLASNHLGLANNPAALGSILQFNLVKAPPGPPPPAPTVTLLTPPNDTGTFHIAGTSVSTAKISMVNITRGYSLNVKADSAGSFSGFMDGEGGDMLEVTAQALYLSPFVSATTTVVVPNPPVLTNLLVSPTAVTFTAAGQFQDLTVTAQYDTGNSNANMVATFSSSSSTVASVNSAGRMVANGPGSASVTASYRGFQATSDITGNIVILTGLVVNPPSIVLVFTGETRNIEVRGQYNNGTTSLLSGAALTFANSDSAIINVGSTGLVAALQDGNAQVYVSSGSLQPKTVPVSVVSGLNPPPLVSITSPANGSGYERGDPVTVSVNAQDPIAGVTKIYLDVTGAVSVADNRQISPPASNVTRAFTFAVPTNAVIGGSFVVKAHAEDIAGLTSAVKIITLNIEDDTPPTVEVLTPTNGQAFNSGHTVTVTVAASDNVGVTTVGYLTDGALLQSESDSFASVPSTNVTFTFIVPPGAPDSNLFIYGSASDAAGNGVTSSPIHVILSDADITPPETEVTALINSTTVVHYAVLSGFDDLDFVQLFFRRNGIGTFNLYTEQAGGTNVLGRFYPQSGTNGTIIFDTTRMGGDGDYEFYTVGFDEVGNREPAPTNGFDQATNLNFGTVWVSITNSLTIQATNTLFDDANLCISNAVVVLEGSHAFRNIDLKGTSVITHAETTTSNEPAFNLTAWTLTIASNAYINVNERGYLGGQREDNFGANEGRTTNNALGATVKSGGSHGGLGGAFTGTPNPLYGSITTPLDLGSGGSSRGDSADDGGDGGGRIRLNVINVAADGDLLANGGVGEGFQAGSGSGGSIYIITHTLSGLGLVAANGGAYQVGGGGGRVAIQYTDISTKDTTLIQALGGDGVSADGGNGTVFLKSIFEGDGTLIVDGQGVASPFSGLPIPIGVTFDNIIIRNDARVIVDDPIVVNDSLQILTGSILTHSVNQMNGLVISGQVVVVDSTSSIDVSDKGYRGGQRDGNASNQGETLNGALGALVKSAGSHGGLGGIYAGAGGNLVYGSPYNPVHLGAGGSSRGDSVDRGGNGGGRVTINATDSVIVDGTIRADGQDGEDFQAGSGAGGSIKINTSLMQGSGIISANGGVSQVGGGGGRILVDYSFLGSGSNDFSDLRRVTAYGGKGSSLHGSAGTILFRQNSQMYGDLYLDESLTNAVSTLWSPLTPLGLGKIQSVTSNQLVLDGGVDVLTDGLEGLILQPNVDDPTTFTIIDNSTTTVTVDVSGGTNLTDVASVGDVYALKYAFDNVYLRRGAFLVTSDKLDVQGMMRLSESGQVTHFDSHVNYEPSLDITVGTLVVDTNGSINVNERGYLGGQRDNNVGFNEGRTTNNALGSTVKSGGSHGGIGGIYASSPGTPNPIYGDLTAPIEMGSGGSSRGDSSDDGGDGGGRVRIAAAAVTLDGLISANGGIGEGFQAGSGSGGSIYISAGTVQGAGHAEANGGVYQIAGGGGRIAVHYTTLSVPQTNFQAIGGDGLNADSGHGTVYFKSALQTGGELVIDGANTLSPDDSVTIPAGFTFDIITLRNLASVLSDAPISVNDSFNILSNSRLSHSQGLETGLVINASHVVIDATSTIDVSGKGYRGGQRDGNASNQGETLNGQLGALVKSAGSHGGLGGIYAGSGSNLVYGSAYNPVHLGAGGSSRGDATDRGGNGGGRVTINATDSLTVHGTIRADGQDGEDFQAGSGAGGSIKINTSLMQGAGILSANGGVSQVGGGGGRILVDYSFLGSGSNDFSDLRRVTAYGGKGSSRHGSAGTVLFRQSSQMYGDLYLDESLTNAVSTLWSPLTPLGLGKIPSVTSNQLVLDGGVDVLIDGLEGLILQPNVDDPTTFTIIDNSTTTVTVDVSGGTNLTDVASVGDVYALNYAFDNVYLRRGAFLVTSDKLDVQGMMRISESGQVTHFDSHVNYEPGLDITVGTLVLDTNGSINVNERGYLGGQHDNNVGFNEGRTTNNALGSTVKSGGSHGGVGGIYSATPGVPNPIYGDLTAPIELGSGGSSRGDSSDDGGDGGGRVHIAAATVTLDGAITANGGIGEGFQAGSGSGGSIYISAATVQGAGHAEANGGVYQTAGGGGRIAVHYTTLSVPQTNFQAIGGDGLNADSGHGTVYFKSDAQHNGDLIVDGFGFETASDSTPIPTNVVFDNVTLRNGARMLLSAPLVVSGAVQVVSNTVLTHALSNESGLSIRAVSLFIDTNSAIDVSSRGYRGGHSDGNADSFGITLSGAAGSTAKSAGSYGGLGGIDTGVPNPVYGTATNPVFLGSGGSSQGSSSWPGGNGGGFIRLVIASNLTLEGVLRADGDTGNGFNSGGGSGGSIKINAGTLTGNGTIEADGGGTQVGGGGGRVAIYVMTLAMDTNRVTASGGAGSASAGFIGTVYFETNVPPPSIDGDDGEEDAPDTEMVITDIRMSDDGKAILHWDCGDITGATCVIEFMPGSSPPWMGLSTGSFGESWTGSVAPEAKSGIFRLREE